jgi:valyl-tRNA synthetase
MTELSKTYNPKEHEERLYHWWEAEGYFKPETLLAHGRADADGPRFCITMPPPNVTGILHLGHAMTAALEDLMTRYYRMRGYAALFLPGSDHAGIATQNVVERELGKEGVTRHDLGRDKFIEQCWTWKEKTHSRITNQHRQLGISCDWERERFTLDETLSHAVRVAFHTLFERGLIYRGPYMVNWCPRCASAISDLEVEPTEHDSHLWTIRYPIKNADWQGPQHPWGSGRWAEGATAFIEMATTRPETILGDSGVAVHPTDARWAALVGKLAVLPALGREIPVVADESVEPEFGTGAVKVTPAHDPTDYETGMRHHLPQIDVMTTTGIMNAQAGPYAGWSGMNVVKPSSPTSRRKAAGQSDAVSSHRRSLPALRHRHRAAHQHAVVRPHSDDGRTGDSGGARRNDAHHPGTFRENLVPLDGEHPRLVHQPPTLVGTPHSGVVLPGL